MTWVLAVDGGTSKTVAIVADEHGTVVAHVRGPGSNIYEGDAHEGLEHAMQTAEGAVKQTGIALADIQTSIWSMSGADWPEDHLLFRAAARARGFGGDVHVVNDSVGGLYAGMPGVEALAVICGTHCATCARGADGTLFHTSFWQGIGGATDLGAAGMRAVYRSELGIDSPTELTPAVLKHFDQPDVETMLHAHTALFAESVPDVAKLAPLVLDIAEAGDAVAREIVIRQGIELARYAGAAARKVGIEGCAFDLVLGGSVFKHRSRLLAHALADELRITSPALRVKMSELEPVAGALLLGYERIGIMVGGEMLRRIREGVSALVGTG